MARENSIPRPTRGSEVKLILDAERLGTAFLIVRDADNSLVVEPLVDSPFIVGRLGSSHLQINWDDEVSRIHAEFVKLGEYWLITDDGLSRNGTFVGSDRVTGRRTLSDGDILRFGSSLAVFRDPREIGSHGTTVVGGRIVVPELTEPQKRVLRALCRPALDAQRSTSDPATNREIAEELFLSVDAVKGHLRILFVKFEVADLPQNRKRSALVDRAMRVGLLGPPARK